jgi:hypothetical protein
MSPLQYILKVNVREPERTFEMYNIIKLANLIW